MDIKIESLDTLQATCHEQIQRFRAGDSTERSVSCAEIVRRAAEGDDTALEVMLELTVMLLRPRSSALRPERVDATLQAVRIRLWQRFRLSEQRFNASSFAAFYTYVNLTLQSVIRNHDRTEQTAQRLKSTSLDELHEEHGFEPVSVPDMDSFVRREQVEQILDVLTDEKERIAVRSRYLFGETPDEILVTLRKIEPEITKEDVYKLLECALKRLQKSPKVRYILDQY